MLCDVDLTTSFGQTIKPETVITAQYQICFLLRRWPMPCFSPNRLFAQHFFPNYPVFTFIWRAKLSVRNTFAYTMGNCRRQSDSLPTTR